MAKSKIKDDFNSKDIVKTYDELPLWAAPFGLKLLEKIEYKKNIKLLDIGCGTGFPSIELAQRLGNTSDVYSIDLWEAALKQAAYKAVGFKEEGIQRDCYFNEEEKRYESLVLMSLLDREIKFSK